MEDMEDTPIPTQAEIVRALMISTGLSDEGVRHCLRQRRLPHNTVIAGIWRQTMASLGLPDLPDLEASDAG